MSILDPIKPYWLLIKWGGIAIAFVSCIAWAHHKDYEACDTQNLGAKQAALDMSVRRAVKTDRALADALKKIPATGRKVNDAVNSHPTSPDCRVPDAAADALQDGIRASQASAAN